MRVAALKSVKKGASTVGWKGKRLLEECAKFPWNTMCVRTPRAEGVEKAEASPPPDVLQVIVIL